MMKKYKLIKEYTGSPDCGDIRNEQELALMFGYNNFKDYSYSDNFKDHFKYNWEEVVEKDYEILSFKNEIYPFINWTKTNNIFKGGLNNDESKLEHQLLNSFRVTIHSIKRLSDGEVFTVGDKVHLYNGNYYTSILKELKIVENGESGHLKEHRNKSFLKVGIQSIHSQTPTFFYLKDVIKTKKPLFTTEDGVDVFEGNNCYLVFTTSYKPAKTIARKELLPIQSHQKFFSTEKAAEVYVLMNKPCLSLKEVNTVLFQAGVGLSTYHESKLTKLIKERI